MHLKKFQKVKYLAQGTLYPDIIESKSSTGSKTSKIKSANESETIGDKNKSSEGLKTSSASQS